MSILETIRKRREITAFAPDPVPPDLQAQLEEALHLAPTGNHTLSRRFIVVRDRQRLDRLSETTPWTAWLRQAPLGIVVVAEPGASKYWLQDATIAGAFLWLAATDLGLGMAWGAVYHSEDPVESERRESHVRAVLAVPNRFRVVAIYGLGWPARQPGPKTPHPRDEVFFYETWSGKRGSRAATWPRHPQS
ncbi:nitroreductase family protein [Limisphaera sp. 4302-co]|uniref:nitroreductase family protein n=1 Tax=Limisphaera sp. 4302-co TaxID=3400417 RepID=UPI003C135A0F